MVNSMLDFSAKSTGINFLNEVASEYPSAVSFAAGKPAEKFFEKLDPEGMTNSLMRYESYAAGERSSDHLRAKLLQYGRTAGIINELVAQQLSADEGIKTSPDRVIVTCGCQEALSLCFPALCPDRADVILVCNPTYIGATCAAQSNGVSIYPLPRGISDVAEGIEEAVRTLRRSGRNARAVYLIPDFDNPTGRVLTESERKAILRTCTRHRIIVLEDNPYGMFRYEGEAIPPMASLDQDGCVIYLSTFSKTLAPAVRVGAATLPEFIFGDQIASRNLIRAIVERKSFQTVNTSQITQAIVGGILLEQNCSLQQWIQPALRWYKTNRDTMLAQLQLAFDSMSSNVRWNHPAGGFFLSLHLPFRFDSQALCECATSYGVIVTPMEFFALDESQNRSVRLAFSGSDPEQIRTGIMSFAKYVERRVVREGLVNKGDTSIN